MHRFRILAVVAASGLAFGGNLAQAEDTPAQAAARAALQQQMNQMDNGQAPGSTNSTPPPATPSAPPEAPTAPPATPSTEQPVQPPPVAAPTPQFSTNIPVNPEMQSKMAPAGMSQTNEPATAQMNTQSSLPALTMPPPAVLMTNDAAYPVNPPMAPLPPAEGSTQPPSAPLNTQPVSLPSTGPGTPVTSTPGAQKPPSVPNPTGVSIQNEPRGTNSAPNYDNSMTAPPLPISQQQQAELSSLLSRYMANQITPAQYQEQRAQIIGQQ